MSEAMILLVDMITTGTCLKLDSVSMGNYIRNQLSE